jgi:hypothetical protein
MLVGFVGAMLQLFEPGFIEQVIAGEVEGMPITHELLLAEAILLVIPPIMVFLSLTLKGRANRWTNGILGIFFIAFAIIEMVSVASAYYVFTTIVGLVLTALIVGYAWKWPKGTD